MESTYFLDKKRNILSMVKSSMCMSGKISAQPHPTLCIQFLNRGNNDKNNTFPLGKQICFTIVWGCAETLPYVLQIYASAYQINSSKMHNCTDTLW